MQNVRPAARNVPEHYTESQYRILCRIIKQKKISKRFFNFVLSGLFQVSDWKRLNYNQMYELIRVLTNLDYEKVRM